MANTAAVKKVKMKKSRQDWILDIIIYTLSVIILLQRYIPFITCLCFLLMKG